MKLNVPNRLTLLRVLLVPVFMIFAANTNFGEAGFSRVMSGMAGATFSIASFTDYLDGSIARKRNLVSDFGKFADPLADKMLTTAALIYMCLDGVCSPVVLALVLFREFAVAGVRMIAAAGNHVVAANIWGKIKTVIQMITVIIFYFAAALFPAEGIGLLSIVTQVLCWVIAFSTVVSGIKYLWDNRSFIKL